jgi:hypothetical protein
LVIQQELAKRCQKSKTRGRKATPAEVVLRMLLLKHVRNWSYERPEVIEKLHRRVVEIAQKNKIATGRRMRVDQTSARAAAVALQRTSRHRAVECQFPAANRPHSDRYGRLCGLPWTPPAHPGRRFRYG